MRTLILIFYFTSSLLFIIGIFYYFILFNRRIEKRIHYYLSINKDNKIPTQKTIKKKNSVLIKNLNKTIQEKLSHITKDKNDQLLKNAGVNLNSEEYIMIKWFLSSIIGGILYFLSNNFYLLFIGAIIAHMLPKMWLKRKIKSRIAKFNEGLPDMITTIIGSLKSGYSFLQALKTVSEECNSPIKDEALLLLKEMNCGITLNIALNNLSSRIPSNDLELMIEAILIQRQVGGNLAEILDTIAKTIRDRNKIQRQVQSLTAQGRLSGKIIGFMPIVLGIMIYLINPDYMKVLFTNTIGIILMCTGIVSGIIGFILIHKLTKIEV